MFAEFRDVHAAYDGVEVLRGINLSVSPGEMVGIIGPNGSGKSTLLKVLTGSLGLTQGAVFLAGSDVSRLRARDRARLVGVVAQHSDASFAFTVWDVVAMGRHAHLAPFRSLQDSDRVAIRWALEQTDCMGLRDRLITELSGGEAQRVVIARALAQEPQGLLLDEPTNHLDLNHQLEIAHLLRELNQQREMTVIWVSHDLNLAAEFCNRIVAVGNGEVVADGTPEQVITNQLLRDLYQVNVPVIKNPLSGRPQLVLTSGEEYAA